MTCPWCSEPFTDTDPRRKWCSPRCRKQVNALGGPAGAARYKRGWAAVLGSAGQRRDAKRYRAEATALEALAQQQPRRVEAG